MPSPSKTTTTIRMGAGHYDLSYTGGPEPLTMDLSVAKRPDKIAIAKALCEAYGINDRRGKKQYAPCPSCSASGIVLAHDGGPRVCHECHGDTVVAIKHKRKRKKHHEHGTQGNAGPQAAGPNEAGDAVKRPRRRRRKPRTVPAPGQDA